MSASAESMVRELVMTRVFNAPRALVFKLWTDPRHLMRWWGPRDYPATEMKADVRSGGRWRGCLTHESGDALWLGGVYREVKPPERLAFTFAWEAEGERGLETLVTVDFVEERGKTKMTFRHAPFQSLGEYEGHQGGWNSTFDRLEDYVAQVDAAA